jgi:cytochrome c553
MRTLLLTAMLVCGASLALPAHGADVAAGKAKAADGCADCHGDDGKGDAEEKVPAITGLSVEKFTKAITEYQDGTRTKSAKMTKEAKKLSAADVANLAAYYATLK